MRSLGLGSFLGLTTQPARWERAFLLAAAFVVGDFVMYALGYGIRYSAETGFTIGLFRFAPSGTLVMIIVGHLLSLAAVVLALRLVRSEAWALVLAAVGYAVVEPPVLYLLRLIAGNGVGGAIWQAGDVLASVLWTLGLFGSLALALGWPRRPGPALVIGGMVGALVGMVLSVLAFMLTGPSAEWSLNLGFLVRNVPRSVVSGALFGCLAWAGLAAAGCFRDETPRPYLRRAFYVGSFIAVNALGLAYLLAVRLFMLLGVWGRRTAAEQYMREDLKTEAAGILVLGGLLFLVAVAFAVVWLRFIHRMWRAIQDGHARTSPGRAVKLLFVPFYDVYWVFQVWVGFASDFNAYVRRRGLALAALPRGRFLAFVMVTLVSWVPFLEIAAIAAAILGAVLIGRICDGVNGLAAAGAAT